MEAKDFISKMLTVDPAKRPGARDCLKHPWLATKEAELPAMRLTGAQEEMKKWAARRRLKAAASAIVVVRRMGRLMDAVKKAE